MPSLHLQPMLLLNLKMLSFKQNNNAITSSAPYAPSQPSNAFIQTKQQCHHFICTLCSFSTLQCFHLNKTTATTTNNNTSTPPLLLHNLAMLSLKYINNNNKQNNKQQHCYSPFAPSQYALLSLKQSMWFCKQIKNCISYCYLRSCNMQRNAELYSHLVFTMCSVYVYCMYVT